MYNYVLITSASNETQERIAYLQSKVVVLKIIPADH